MDRKAILHVVLGYAVIAALWILLSDTVLYRFWPGAESIYRIGLLKGLAFVVVTTTILYVLMRWTAESIRTREEQTRATNALAASARDQAERALHESEQRWRAVFENEPECVKLVDRDGNLSAMNAAGLAMLEANSLHEVQQRTLLHFIVPEHRASFGALHKRVMKGESGSLEFDITGLKGARRRLETCAAPMRAADGTVTTLLGITRDITERKRAEDALRQSETRIRNLFEQAADGIFVITPDHRFLDANEQGLRMLGYPREELLRLRVADVMVEAERHRLDVEVPEMMRGAPHLSEWVYLRKDGSTFPAEVSARPLSGDQYLAIVRDLTARKTAEKELRDSEHRWRTMFDQAADGIAVIDFDRRFVDANQAFLGMLGYSRKEFLRLRVEDVVAEQERHRVEPEATDLYRGIPHLSEWTFQRKDGSTFVAEVSARVLPNYGGLAIIRDLTERRTAERALREFSLRLQLAAKSGNVGMWDWDLRTNKVFFSPEWKSQIGHEDHEIAGDFSEWESRLHPDDRDRAVRTAQAFIEKPDGGFHSEFRLRHKDGSYRWILAQGEVQKDDRGKPIHMLGTHVDITERKRMELTLQKTEARMRSMADHSPLGITLKDLDGRYVFVNERVSEWHGVRPEDAIGRTVSELFPDRRPEPMQAQERALFAGHPFRRTESVRFHDGSMHDLEIIKFLVPGPEVTLGSLAIDVTNQRQIEEQLRQAQKLEAVGQLTGGLAHDFNNLLTVIMGNLEILAGPAARDPDAAKAVQRGLRATQRGAELTRRLLAFSRRQELSPGVVDVNAMIREMTQLLRRTLGETIQIRTDVHEDIPLAFIDAGQLENALLNLAINARDAMPQGGQLSIEAMNASIKPSDRSIDAEVAPGDYVLVTVRDTGTGMPPEVCARTFEPFFTTKEVGKGSGLGLSMVYGFMRQSGGHVTIDSEVGKGTAVKLYLPCAPAGAVAESTLASPEEHVGHGERVLLVEDDPNVRQTTIDMLEGLGYAILPAGNGPDALASLSKAEPISLLLTDVVLPKGMSGIDVAEALRRTRPSTKVLFMSGYANVAAANERIKALGATLLSKPFTRVQLSHAVSRALRT